MNLPTDRSPLDPDERELARIYRALPDGEPPSALDARIRAAAHAAVAKSRPLRLRPWPWGLSTAAAALLALALLWQSGLPPQREMTDEFGEPVPAAVPEATFRSLPEESVGAAAPAGAASKAASEQPDAGQADASAGLDRIEVSGTRVRAQEQFVPEPPADAPRQVAPAAPAPLPGREPVAADPDRAARVRPPPAVLEGARETGRGETTAGAERRDYEEAHPMPPAPQPRTVAAPALHSAALPPLAGDERLEPEAWLERIRDRLATGDREGATWSLQRFGELHPEEPVPEDLQALLQ